MPTNYPGALDTFPTRSTEIIPASDFNNPTDAIEAIEAELGTDPSGSAATVAARIGVLEEAPLNVDHYGGNLATAVAALPATGGRLYIPENGSTRAIAASLLPANNVEIFGDGIGATVLRVSNGVTLTGGALQWTNGQRVHVHDLTIDLNKANTPDSNNDSTQQGFYFYNAAGGSTRGRVERVLVKNGHRMHYMAYGATLGDPLVVDFIDCDSEDSGHIGLYGYRWTGGKVVRGNYLRSQEDNIQLSRSSRFTIQEVTANGSIAGHGVVAGPMCSEFAYLGGLAESNNESGFVASVRCKLFRMIGQRARANGALGITVDVRNESPTLTSAINSSVTTIPVTFNPSDNYLDHVAPGVIRIDSETITYTGVTSTDFTGCVRGAQGTVAASHSLGAQVNSDVFHATDSVLAGYVCSENLIHGIYHQFGKDLVIGPGSCFGNGVDGMLVSAYRTTIDGLSSHDNAGRGLAFTNTASGQPTGDHRVSESCRFNGNAIPYEDNATDVSIAALTGSGTPEGVVKAGVGSTFKRRDGGAGTTFYVKQSGTGNTGWVGK